jgi:hypothetical protein
MTAVAASGFTFVSSNSGANRLIRYIFLSEGRAGRTWERSNHCSAGRGGTLDKTVLPHCVVCEGFQVTADAVHGYYRVVKG